MYVERPSRLAGAVVWRRTMPANPANGSAMRILPDGCLDLIWSGGAVLVAGPDTKAHLVSAAPGTHYAGLRFPPGTGPVVLGVPAYEVRDMPVPLADLWPAACVRRLTDDISAAANLWATLEEVAASRLRQAGPPSPVVADIVARLRSGTPVAATAESVGVNERRLHRLCLAAFGYGPKTLARILRMRRALRMARAGMPFASVAAIAGYADQAHLAREVKALVGVPLGALKR